MLKTTDGGENWSVVYSDLNATGHYAQDISCYDASTCVFVMDGTNTPLPALIATTRDGGGSWSLFETPSPAGPGNSLYTMRMVGPTEAWVAGGDGTGGRGNPEEGQMWYTTDLGAV